MKGSPIVLRAPGLISNWRRPHTAKLFSLHTMARNQQIANL